MFSIVREPCANNSFFASFTPLAEHILLYTITMHLSIFYRDSELTSTGCRDRSRKAYVTDVQELHHNHADFSPQPRKLDTVSHQLIALRNVIAFSSTFLTISWIEICRKWVPTPKLTQSSPKRREMLYCKDNQMCVHGSDYHFVKSLSCTMRNVEQNARICLLVGTWLEILDIIHVILRGDDRFILCADDHLSASFASLCALGQIAKQFIFISITPQESLPVRAGIGSPAITRCLCIVPLGILWSIVDCFRLLVRYLSQTISTLLTVSGWEVVYERNICWEYSSNVR